MKQITKLVLLSFLLFIGSIQAQKGKSEKLNSNQYQKQQNDFGSKKLAKAEKMQKAFDLTDEQIKRISDLRFEHEKLELDLKNKIAFNKLIIEKMMSDNEINENKLLELTQTNGELKTKIKLSETKLWIGIYNTLNDEQKEKWTKTFGHRFGKNGLKHKMGQYRFESENFNKFHIRKNVR